MNDNEIDQLFNYHMPQISKIPEIPNSFTSLNDSY